MKLFVLYPHGLGDCILLTPAIKEYYKLTGYKVGVATLERFRTAMFFDNNPYVGDIFYTKDAWHDYENPHLGFRDLHAKWKQFAKEQGYQGFVMPMHSNPISKIKINLDHFGIKNPQDFKTEIYTTKKDKLIADKIIKKTVGNRKFGFIQTNTGVSQKNLPFGYGQEWLSRNKNLENFIEIGKTFDPLEYNINIQFEIMRQAEAVCLPDSVFYHACHAMGKKVDFVYFGRGQQVYERVRHFVASEENVVFKL